MSSVLPVVVWNIRNWPPEVERPAAVQGEGTVAAQLGSKTCCAIQISGGSVRLLGSFQYLYRNPVQHDALRNQTFLLTGYAGLCRDRVGGGRNVYRCGVP